MWKDMTKGKLRLHVVHIVIYNTRRKLTHSIRDFAISIDFVQGTPGSRREQVKKARDILSMMVQYKIGQCLNNNYVMELTQFI